jgi:hypothetical protein
MRPKGHRHIVAPAGQHDITAPSAAWLAGGRPGITGVTGVTGVTVAAPAEAPEPAKLAPPAEAPVPAEASPA